MVVLVVVLIMALVCAPLGCYIFANYLATDDDLEDIEAKWWYRSFVSYGRWLRRLVLPFNPKRRSTWSTRTERATLLQDEGGTIHPHQTETMTTRRRNTSSC